MSKKRVLFAGWEVRAVKNCDLGLENAALGPRQQCLQTWLLFFKFANHRNKSDYIVE